MQRWWTQPDTAVVTRLLDVFDGVRPGRASFNRAAKSPDGRLWFSSGVAVQSIDPRALEVDRKPAPLYVEGLSADGRAYDAGTDLRVAANPRNLQIDYSALSLAVPQRVQFRHRLLPLDEEWHDAGAHRQAFFTDLAPGDYRFEVMASNSDGVWGATPASLRFAVAPAWYQTWAFRVLCAVVLGLALWGLYRQRLRQLSLRLQALLEERHRERERIARELHDTLLQSIQGLILRFQVAADRAADEATRSTLNAALDRAEATLSEGRDRVRDLRSATRAGADLAQELARLCEEHGLPDACQATVTVTGTPLALDPLVVDDVLGIAREALANAFQHAAAQFIEVEIDYSSTAFRLRVCDDGCGIDGQVAEGGKPGHWGLSGMHERAQRMGGRLTLWSRPGAGTQIELVLDRQRAYADAAVRRGRFLRGLFTAGRDL